MAASSYSTVRLKTQPEPHECILLCISHHTQILWWSEQFSSSNRGCSFACESCKTTQSHQWFFEPDGLCVVWVHPEAKQCETGTCTYPAGAASAPFSHLSCLVGAASRSQRWFVWTPSPPHSGNKPSWSLKSSPHERGGKKARLRRGVGLTPHTKYQIKKKKKEEEGLLCAQQSDPNRLYPDTDNGAR